jgi:hypothetical protein
MRAAGVPDSEDLAGDVQALREGGIDGLTRRYFARA